MLYYDDQICSKRRSSHKSHDEEYIKPSVACQRFMENLKSAFFLSPTSSYNLDNITAIYVHNVKNERDPESACPRRKLIRPRTSSSGTEDIICLTPDAQATGNVGRPIVDALVAASFTVTVGTRHVREDTDSKFPPSVSVKIADPERTSSLTTAFAGQDAIVEAFNPTAARFQINVVEAAMQRGVKHIITPDFGSDTFHVNAPELKIFEPKIEAQRLLEESLRGSGIRWTAVITGPFFDWGEPEGPCRGRW